MISILTITGSDNSGFSGLQQDIRIITEMGGHAMTSATCDVTQDQRSIMKIDFFPEDRIRDQVMHVVSDFHPKAVKVGLVGDACSVKAVAEEIAGCRKIVVAPGIISSRGMKFADISTIEAIKRFLIPIATIVVLRCDDAEMLLDTIIATDYDMKYAANAFLEMGTEYVLLRGGKTSDGRVTALLAGKESSQFFSSYYIEGWQKHGVGGALSVAIATRLGMGDDVPSALRNAHEFIHSRVVYAVNEDEQKQRPADVYNTFMNLIADNYSEIHDVTTYADKLNVSTRYLSMITAETISKSPKQVIADFLLEKARQLLLNSRLSVKEIAVQLGFTTSPVFCKFFRQQEGITPTQFRNSVELLSQSE